MTDLFDHAAERRWERAQRAYDIAEPGYRQMRLKALRLPAIESMMPALDVTAIQAKLAEKARSSGYVRPYLIGSGDE